MAARLPSRALGPSTFLIPDHQVQRNITGVNFLQSELGAKRLGLLHELLPKASVIGMLVNPTFADAETYVRDAKEAALPLGLEIHAVRASTVDDFDPAFAALAQQKVDALLLANDALFTGERRKLIALAARYAIPAVYFWREFAVDGGLMSYSSSNAQAGLGHDCVHHDRALTTTT
jgi:putative tryptophan/tyrosine transport system substrate-binding protein